MLPHDAERNDTGSLGKHAAGLLHSAARVDLRAARGMCEGSWVEGGVPLASALRPDLRLAGSGPQPAQVLQPCFPQKSLLIACTRPLFRRGGQCAAFVGVGVGVLAAAPFASAVLATVGPCMEGEGGDGDGV